MRHEYYEDRIHNSFFEEYSTMDWLYYMQKTDMTGEGWIVALTCPNAAPAFGVSNAVANFILEMTEYEIAPGC